MDNEPKLKLPEPYRRTAPLILTGMLLVLAGCNNPNQVNNGKQPNLLPTPTLAPISPSVEALQMIKENTIATIPMNNQRTFHYELDEVRLPDEGSVRLSTGILFDGEYGVLAASAITEGSVMTQILERAAEQPALGELYDKLVFGGTATIFHANALSPEMKDALLELDNLHVFTTPLPTTYDENGNPIEGILQSVVYDNDGKPFLTVRFRPTDDPNKVNRFDILDIQVLPKSQSGLDLDSLYGYPVDTTPTELSQVLWLPPSHI